MICQWDRSLNNLKVKDQEPQFVDHQMLSNLISFMFIDRLAYK